MEHLTEIDIGDVGSSHREEAKILEARDQASEDARWSSGAILRSFGPQPSARGLVLAFEAEIAIFVALGAHLPARSLAKTRLQSAGSAVGSGQQRRSIPTTVTPGKASSTEVTADANASAKVVPALVKSANCSPSTSS